MYSSATRRMVSAGTSLSASAHSGRVLGHMVQHQLEGRLDLDILMHPAVVVGAEFVAGHLVAAFHRGIGDLGVDGFGAPVRGVPDQRLTLRIAHEVAVRTDQIRRVGHVLEEGHIADLFPAAFDDDAVDEREEERGVGLGL